MNTTIKTKEQLIDAIKNGDPFTVHGRPVRIWNGHLVVEVRTGRGKAYAHFSSEDLDKLNH